MKRYLECGKIVSLHGLRGEVKVQPWCDSPDFLLGFSTLYLKKGGVSLAVEGGRLHKSMALLKLKGYDNPEQAAALRGMVLYIDREDAPAAEEGEFFVQDLIGLRVLDADSGRLYGELSDVFATGANDVYEITGEDGKKKLIPALRDVVLETDTGRGVMRIRPLKGLLDDAD